MEPITRKLRFVCMFKQKLCPSRSLNLIGIFMQLLNWWCPKVLNKIHIPRPKVPTKAVVFVDATPIGPLSLRVFAFNKFCKICANNPKKEVQLGLSCVLVELV